MKSGEKMKNKNKKKEKKFVKVENHDIGIY